MADGLLLQWTKTGARFELPVSAPPFPLDSASAQRVTRTERLLDALWGESLLQPEGERAFVLPYDQIYALSDWDQRVLGMPVVDPSLTLSLASDGYVGRDLKVEAEVLRAGVRVPAQRVGAIVIESGQTSLVPFEAWRVLELVDRGLRGDRFHQFLALGRILKAARAAGASLDAGLEAEDIQVADGLDVEVDVRSHDHIEVRPIPKKVEEFGDFAEGWDAPGPPRNQYRSRDGAKRRRLIVSTEDRDTAAEVRTNGHLRGADVPEFLSNPEAFLPDGIDIDMAEFSARVRGLVPRKYQSQPYLVASPGATRDWFQLSPQIDLIAEDSPGHPVGVPDPDEMPTGEKAVDRGQPPEPETVAVGTLELEEYARLARQAVESGDRWVYHNDAWIEIDPADAQRFLERLEELPAPNADGVIEIPKSDVGLVLDVISNVDELEFEVDGSGIGQRFALDDVPVPVAFKATLHPYQYEGFKWMCALEREGLGGLLADEMGLGKTVQVIAYLTHLHSQGKLAPTLIVLPKTLIPNWRRELVRFSPTIPAVHTHEGPGRERDPVLLSRHPIVLTSYDLLRRDQLILGRVDWSIVICDEAQRVKNPTAGVTRSVKALKSPRRLALTGTPVENGLSELWCILDYVHPGRLGSRTEFRDNFERPIVSSEGPAEREGAVKRLVRRMDPLYLRRLKADVLDLPDKVVVPHPVGMGSRQQRIYRRIVTAVRAKETNHLGALQRLISACSHPELVEPSGAPVEELIKECPKLAVTMRVLREIQAKGEKAIVFTTFHEMQRILREAILSECGVLAGIINGGVGTDDRFRLVESFAERDGFDVLLLGPKSAGVGLNITAANHVIHYTRWWNPAVEAQATDRCHRIGQDKTVYIHYPLVSWEDGATLEQQMDELIRERTELAGDVLVPRTGSTVEAALKQWLETQSPVSP